MKTKLLVAAALLAIVIPIAVAGLVYRRALASPFNTYNMHAYMMGAGNGRFGFGMMAGGYGQMHDAMVAALAGALGLSAGDVQSRMVAGETPWQIAQSTGLSEEAADQAVQSAHDQALEQAVQSGAITRDQADWMDRMMEQSWIGAGFGCHGGGTGSPATSTEQ